MTAAGDKKDNSTRSSRQSRQNTLPARSRGSQVQKDFGTPARILIAAFGQLATAFPLTKDSLASPRGSGDAAEEPPPLGCRVVKVMVRREEFASGEVAEDVGEWPGADDLAVASDGQFVRNVGE
jgi:hypothetical protein